MTDEQTDIHRRIEGIDLAWFVALVGMVFVNFDIVMVSLQAGEGASSFLATAL